MALVTGPAVLSLPAPRRSYAVKATRDAVRSRNADAPSRRFRARGPEPRMLSRATFRAEMGATSKSSGSAPLYRGGETFPRFTHALVVAPFFVPPAEFPQPEARSAAVFWRDAAAVVARASGKIERKYLLCPLL